MNTSPRAASPRALLIIAFATVYVVWGSTYLAIRVAVETIPPFLMAGLRFVFAGSVLYFGLRMKGIPNPTRKQWFNAGLAGILMLVGGNGLVVWAEQTVPSGLAALLVALTPVWFVLLEWLRPSGRRPAIPAIVGTAVGFAGVALLVSGRNSSASAGPHSAWAEAALVGAGFFWAAGSLWSRYNAKPESPWMNAALQMIAGGGCLLLLSTLDGEVRNFRFEQVASQSWIAWVYLVAFGSWIAFSAYVWLLKTTTPTLLATYAYVNPVIAVFLGKVILGEPFGLRAVVAASIILFGVMITTLSVRR